MKSWTQVQREQHRAYVVMESQALYRGEEWQLTEQEFLDLWQGQWHLRGRDSHSMTMTRCDPDGAWIIGNVEIINRAEHVRRCLQRRRQLCGS